MNDNKIKVSAQYKPMQDSVELFIHTSDAYCTKIEMKHDDNLGSYHIPASLEINRDMAQRLLDQLWNIGLRPYNNKYGDEVVKTMANHLDDMRNIAFKFLEIERTK